MLERMNEVFYYVMVKNNQMPIEKVSERYKERVQKRLDADQAKETTDNSTEE